ncbi:MAG: FAD-dependent oxidoreductase [Myxococcaceae bacterium]
MNKNLRISAFYALVLYWPFSAYAVETVKIVPPNLEDISLGDRVLCHRPMRRQSPKMAVEKWRNKIIVHHYGLGGSGWTLAPGAAEHVNNLLLDSFYAEELTEDTPITVIGAGVSGFFVAYNLVKRGFKNISILADKFDALPSHQAGGLFAPVSMDNDPEAQKMLNDIGFASYKFYEAIAQKKHPDFPDGASIIPAYFENRQDSGLEPYVDVVIPPAKEVILDFGRISHKMVVYEQGIFIDTPKMMIHLEKFLRKSGVYFRQRRLSSFDEVESKFIINCAGLGAGELNHDEAMVSVQGHLILLKNQSPSDFRYMILVYFETGKTKAGLKVRRSFLFLPKRLLNRDLNDIGLIGGTYVEGGTSETPNTEEFDVMLENARRFLGLTTYKSEAGSKSEL